MSIVITDDEHFNSVFEDNKSEPMILFFTASWCGPCQQIKPFLEKSAGELIGKLTVLKIDVDECDEICQKYSVTTMPTFILIVHGVPTENFSGANETKLQEMIDNALE